MRQLSIAFLLLIVAGAAFVEVHRYRLNRIWQSFQITRIGDARETVESRFGRPKYVLVNGDRVLLQERVDGERFLGPAGGVVAKEYHFQFFGGPMGIAVIIGFDRNDQVVSRRWVE